MSLKELKQANDSYMKAADAQAENRPQTEVVLHRWHN